MEMTGKYRKLKMFKETGALLFNVVTKKNEERKDLTI